MATNQPEVADIFRRYGDAYRQKVGGLPKSLNRAVRAIQACRTAELGGHLFACDQCGVIRERFNSCRNRHCPKCQWLDRRIWVEKRQEELLPVPYFHVVTTVPDDLLNPVFLRNPKQLYNMLLRVTAESLLTIAADPKYLGAKIGIMAVLHTWGQLLQLHPHVHCIIPGGGISLDGETWVASRPNFFLPVRVISRIFRGKFIEALRKMVDRGELEMPEDLDPARAPSNYQTWINQLYSTEWVVHSKPPFGGSEQGLKYLARYTHRVAISNDRILKLEDDRVHFRYKDYRNGGDWKDTSLHPMEFVRRFLLHILPDGFHRIRYYGLLTHRFRKENLKRCRELLDVAPPESADPEPAPDDPGELWFERVLRLTGVDPTICPLCGEGRLVVIETLEPPANKELPRSRAPP